VRRLRAWLSRLLGALSSRHTDRDLSDELESHIGLHVDDLVRRGVDPAAARRHAISRFGGVESVKEAYRDRRGLPLLETVIRDVRYAARSARKSPGFMSVAILNLALGIGLNTAVFSVVNAVLLRRPAYLEPDRLVVLRERFPAIGEATLGMAQAEYLDYRDRTRAFSAMAGHESAVFDLTGGPEPVRIHAQRATHTLFSTLGVSPLIGRTFSAAEDDPDAPHVIVLGYDLWQRLYGGRSEALGSVLRLNEQPYTVIGVMPAGFGFPFTPADVGEPPSAWVPMAFTKKEIADRAAEFPVQVVARLNPGVSIVQGRQDVERVANGFQKERPDIYSGNLRLEVILEPLGAASAARARPVLLALTGAVAFVLLIACANVSNLLLARAAARQREIAMRSALGASNQRLIGQLLIESLLLTSLGAALGCVFAIGMLRLLGGLWPWLASGVAATSIDMRVLAFTIAVSAITGLACGLAPAAGLRSSGSRITDALKAGGREGSSAPRRGLRSVLVILEASSALVLLIGAGLLLHSFVEIVRVPAGFSPDRVLIARTTFNRQRYPSNDRRRAVERLMADRLAALPAVAAVGVTTHIPLADERQIGFILEGEDIHAARWADNASVSGNYFAAMGISLLRGRTFDDRDAPGAPLSAIVNESMARRFWPNGDGVGKRIVWGGRPLTIVGIVADVHIAALETAVSPMIYTAVYQIESGSTTSAVFIIKGQTSEVSALAASVRDAIWSVDNGVPVFDVRTMSDVVAGSLSTRRFTVALLTSFAALALALAVVGLYSVLAYGVAQRRSELGLRLALGASPRQLVRLVLGDGLRMTAIGLCIGIVSGGLLARAMAKLLYGVPTFDLPAFAGASVVLLLVALAASAIPARRAAHVDPLVALRSE
jgi:putative ABC transport system permease protein